MVEILPNAKKQLKKLDKKLSEKILVEIYKMARDPFACTQVKKLVNTELYRLRVEDYRIIFEKVDNLLLITVIKVKHRREVYK